MDSLSCRAAPRQELIATEPSFFTVVWRQWWLVLAIVVGFMVVGYGLSFLQPTEYESSSDVGLIDPNTAQQLTDQMGLDRNQGRNVANQAEFFESPEIATEASAALDGNPTPEEVEAAISAVPQKDKDYLVLSGRDVSAIGAVQVVDAVTKAYSAAMQAQAEQAADTLIEGYEARIRALEEELSGFADAIAAEPDNVVLRQQSQTILNDITFVVRNIATVEAQLAAYGDGIRSVTEPTKSGTPAQPLPLRNAIIAGVLGILVAVGVVWVRG